MKKALDEIKSEVTVLDRTKSILKEKAGDVRVTALKRIVEFLKLNEVNENRLKCAFLLADNRQAHRSVDSDKYMTKDVSYRIEIACRMWALFGSFASKHGYMPYKQYDCSGYTPLPRVNVGPQGEYDRSWVKPGGKMVDFRVNVSSEQLEIERLQMQRQQQNRGVRPGRRAKPRPKPGSQVNPQLLSGDPNQAANHLTAALAAPLRINNNNNQHHMVGQ
jgi:hypothetical protein